METATRLALAISLACCVYLAVSLRRPARYRRLPPSPPADFLGRTLFPPQYAWRYLYEVAKQQGPVLTIWRGTQPTVMCCDVGTAEFLLEKHARTTASRPHAFVAEEIISHGKRILLKGYDDAWRRLRKALHIILQPDSARQLRSVQERNALAVILDVFEKPDLFQDHIMTYAASLVTSMAYGRRGRTTYADPEIRAVIADQERLTASLKPGANLVDSPNLRWLRYVPGYLSRARRWADMELALFRGAFYEARRQLDNGKAHECFVTSLIEKREELNLSDDDMAYLCGTVFVAGSDTTSAAITICVMAAAAHQSAQKRVQAELDEVVGHARPPSFEDLDNLPVLSAFVQETFRWRPVSAGGFLHKSTDDIVYENYLIPKGTTIVGNHWAIHRDEAYYGADVEDFKIDRFLTPDGRRNPNRKTYQFGFGRRICPGQHVANNSVLINTALLLWSFSIAPKAGTVLDTSAFTNTPNSHPLPFQVAFTARRGDVKSKIEAALAEQTE